MGRFVLGMPCRYRSRRNVGRNVALDVTGSWPKRRPRHNSRLRLAARDRKDRLATKLFARLVRLVIAHTQSKPRKAGATEIQVISRQYVYDLYDERLKFQVQHLNILKENLFSS